MTILQKIKLTIKNVYALFFSKKYIDHTPCEILFLHHKPIGKHRTNNLNILLEKEGFHISHEIMDIHSIFSSKKFFPIKRSAPFSFCWQELYIAYLVERYQPKIFLTFMDSSPMSIFIKERMQCYGGKYINIAHSVVWTSELYCMYHFDYYFIFGKSSVHHAMETKIRYGDTKLVETGSIYIPEQIRIEGNEKLDTIAFFSTYLPEEHKKAILSSFNVLSLWHKLYNSHKLLIKFHPHEDETIIRSYFEGSVNVEFIPATVSLNSVLERASLSILFWSNTAIESSFLKRPVIMLNDSDMEDSYLYIEKYFGERVRTEKALNERVEKILIGYQNYLRQCDKYVDFHLSRRDDALPYTVSCIKSIAEGREDFPVIPIQGTAKYFKG